MKKYELAEETRTLADGTVLHRIRAVRDIELADGMVVKAGDLGGWLEGEGNLSQDGSAWVSGSARVCGDAFVYDKARVSGEAEVYDKARVFGEAEVYGKAEVCGEANVYGHAQVCGDAAVYEKARVYGESDVSGEAWVYGEAEVCGDALVGGEACIESNAVVESSRDYAVYKNTWSSMRWFTYTRSDRMWQVGCFRGTGDELIARAYEDGELSGRCYEAVVRAQEAIDRAQEAKR